MMKSVSKYETPDGFLGGCGSQSQGPRVKLRASWVQPKDAEHSVESLMLKPSKKPADFMGSSSNFEHDATETTVDLDVSVDNIFCASEEEPAVIEEPAPTPTKKWTPPTKKEDDSTQATGDKLDDYLPGCEPKPIRKWTPPPKEDDDAPPKEMSKSWDQPDEFLGGCGSAPTKKWTPPPKEDADAHTMSSTWDQPDQFLGGCAPKETRRWSRPSRN